jgi:alkylated DNA repair dioxygenase AlkB
MSAEAEQAIRDVYTQAFGIAGTEPQVKVQTVSEPYGVVIAETAPSETKTQEFVNLIQPQIKAQAYKENASGTANDMFMYGLRWTRKTGAKAPLVNRSYANGGLPTTDAKAKDGYVYDTVDQNGNPLAPVSDLQPIMDEIQKTLGIDMSNYDAVIGNIYLPGQRIATHRDTTESLSARNYPVVVYTIGNMSGISVYENEKNPGSASFASDKRTTIPTQNGSIYTFGMNGKGRFEMAHDTPGMKREQKFPPITLPNGTTVENYTITLTFRRAADLEADMATSPTKLGNDSSIANKVLEGDIFALPGIPVITTNLGGVHGAGLAQAAKAKGLIKQGEGTFSSSDSVVTLPVKLKWSDDMSMNSNMILLQDSLNGLVNVAKANPQRNYLLPLAGLGHGEGSVEKILPLLINTVKAADNIQLVLPAEDVNLGRQGTVRKDYTRENMPAIKAMLDAAGLLTTQSNAQKFDQSAPATEPVSNKPRFVKEQNSLVKAVDYETGDILQSALIYNDNRFNTKVSKVDPKSGTETTEIQYKLDDAKIAELAADHPDHLFVFDDFWPTATGLRDTLVRNNSRRAWAQAAPQGVSFGLSTQNSNNSPFKSLDANYDELVPIVDAQIEALKEKRNQGKKIVFPATGVGQNLMGFIYKNGELVKGKERPAPNLFVYLSKRLLQEFGFQNPTFDEITGGSRFNTDLTEGKATTMEYIQDYYKELGLQEVTDSEILEQIKNCKGK